MGVGRETTARKVRSSRSWPAYSMGVGRETTAAQLADRDVGLAYSMGVGRETTAWRKTFAPFIDSLLDGSR